MGITAHLFRSFGMGCFLVQRKRLQPRGAAAPVGEVDTHAHLPAFAVVGECEVQQFVDDDVLTQVRRQAEQVVGQGEG